MKKEKSYLTLFIDMLMISAFTFGGGFVIIGMMKKKFYEQRGWISEEEVLDMTAIAQSAPGALAVNSAIIFGYRMMGLAGMFVSLLATIIPPILIISGITLIYDFFKESYIIQTALQVMRAGVAAIIVDVVWGLGKNVVLSKNILNICFMCVAFIASWFFGVSSITIILICIALGICLSLKGEKK